ncbi:nematode resistance protein-like HSPRO2 [Punica granatum]|uniref:Uncharacterized protein n=2 Tax=Punica granatum TaxID=22663 RepID=A0A218XR76_PUNGR|nr:nematode resistance protein-like HSPRO2 [Punica granatum]OWM87434.1 hypothetical protein CDL15_Pgr022545 [Punica granatum]PKI46649.1 hypothetical protein CRG98_032991 [Punica granatum]
MVDLDWKSKRVVSSDSIPNKSLPKLPNKLTVLIPAPLRGGCPAELETASSSACSAYEHYLRLPELRKLWSCRESPEWKSEPFIRPALQALEITFRFLSTVLSDPRPYVNSSEWERQLESITATELQLVSALVESGEGTAPIASAPSFSGGKLARGGSSAEVWRLTAGDNTVVSCTSEASLLPRLAAWRRSEAAAERIQYLIEGAMRRCPYTLGLGEPNLAAKQSLDYDGIVKPHAVHALRQNPYSDQIQNHENQTLYTIHQILESWVQSALELLNRIGGRIESKRFDIAASDCFLLERVWKLLAEIEDLHLLMDPADFLRLKSQLEIKSEPAPFCFRSAALVELTRRCRDLRQWVPNVLGVEVDPAGGPRVQEAAMRLYRDKAGPEKIHLLQGLQSVEAAVKRFFYANKQVVAAVMGSLEAREEGESLSRVFLEPTYFPSLDAAKTFLGDSLGHKRTRAA